MFKSIVLLCVACVVIEARPKWQYLPAMPGYVPVYIQTGDTPLEQINPELAEAFHALPAGRSVSKHIEAAPEELADQPREDNPLPASSEDNPLPASSEDNPLPVLAEDPLPASAEGSVDHRPYAKKVLEKKKKVGSDVAKPIERR